MLEIQTLILNFKEKSWKYEKKNQNGTNTLPQKIDKMNKTNKTTEMK